MDPAAPVFRDDARAGDVAAALRESQRFRDKVVLVVTPEGLLRGTITTVEVLLAGDDERLAALRVQATPTIEAFATRDEVAELLDRQRLTTMPVVDVAGRPGAIASAPDAHHLSTGLRTVAESVCPGISAMPDVGRDICQRQGLKAIVTGDMARLGT